MSAVARYLTHPEVVIDPKVPVTDWGLSAVGKARVGVLVASGILQGTRRVICSDERKARDTAEPVAAALGVPCDVDPAMGENDRAATGYLPRVEFEAVADAFFARPDRSVRGWETALAAQNRIVAAVGKALAGHDSGDVLFVGHGGVGTLLYCHLAGVAISREMDQQDGGGCLFAFDPATRAVASHWSRIEDVCR